MQNWPASRLSRGEMNVMGTGLMIKLLLWDNLCPENRLWFVAEALMSEWMQVETISFSRTANGAGTGQKRFDLSQTWLVNRNHSNICSRRAGNPSV